MVSLVCAMVLPSIPVAAQSRDDEVMVSKCSEVYEFKMKGGQPIVKNKTVIEYESLRQYDVKIQPAVFYGDNIKLDEARCDGFSANYRSATPENVFFDDSRVCYFDVTLGKWGRKRRMTYERTFTDLHYFTRIVLGEQYFVKQKTVTFILPKEFEHYRLVDKNMSPAVTIEHKDKGGSRVVTYTINDMAPIKQEEAMPTVASVYPTVFVVGSFKDAADMFAWGRQLSDVDTAIPSLSDILADINRECHSDLDKIKNTYAWVQNNIRYVAFEEGISGHQPDKPAEVVRKRYGDCKGMALLLKTLLVAQGFDARLTDVGTREASCPDERDSHSCSHQPCHLYAGVAGQNLLPGRHLQPHPAGPYPQQCAGHGSHGRGTGRCPLVAHRARSTRQCQLRQRAHRPDNEP